MKYAIPDTVSTKTIGKELFVFNRTSGNIHSFSETGAYIWKAIVDRRDTADIVRLLKSEFEVNDECAEQDLSRFLSSLREIGLINEQCT